MAEFVTTGGTIKRTNARFGGNTAHRQHEDERKEKLLVCKARRLADDKLTAVLILDSDWDAEPARCGETCACTGLEKPRNGVVREGNIQLVYVEGKLLSAHCG
jgi:hypothetical protein